MFVLSLSLSMCMCEVVDVFAVAESCISYVCVCVRYVVFCVGLFIYVCVCTLLCLLYQCVFLRVESVCSLLVCGMLVGDVGS